MQGLNDRTTTTWPKDNSLDFPKDNRKVSIPKPQYNVIIDVRRVDSDAGLCHSMTQSPMGPPSQVLKLPFLDTMRCMAESIPSPYPKGLPSSVSPASSTTLDPEIPRKTNYSMLWQKAKVSKRIQDGFQNSVSSSLDVTKDVP